MLNCPYIKWLESCGTVYDFNKQYGALIKVIKESNNYKGQYHDTEHLIKTGYLAYLTGAAFIRNNSTGMINPYYEVLSPELSLVVKAALLHDYCYLGESDDSLNIMHTQNMIRTLAVEHSDILSPDEAKEICRLVEYTHYDFNNPEGNPPLVISENIYFDILRDCDQLYASLYFNKELFFKLYEDIGKRFSYNIDDFVLRNKQYCQVIGSSLKTDFAQKVYKEVINELLELHDDLYYAFPNCHVDKNKK